MKIKSGLMALAGALMVFTTSCKKEESKKENPQGEFTLELDHHFNNSPFNLNETYQNQGGEALRFTKVRYYISNIELESIDGKVWRESDSYHLVDLSDPASTLLKIQDVPPGDYHHLSFLIGVDSLRNVSGAQEGALDPINDMFWSWNSGYIFLKLEGESPQAADSSFMYHMGGFSGTQNAIRQVSNHMHHHMLTIAPGASPQVHFMVDLKKAFDGMHEIRVAATPKIHMPGPMAVQLSHNFQAAFSMDHIHN